MKKDKDPTKTPELKGFEDIEIEGFEDKIDLKFEELELDTFDLTLEPFLLISNKELEKIIEDIWELGDLKGKTSGEVVELLRNKWHNEEGLAYETREERQG